MTRKQTSPAISTIAGKYVRMTNAQMYDLAVPDEGDDKRSKAFFRDIRKLAASCLSQDEIRGQGK